MPTEVVMVVQVGREVQDPELSAEAVGEQVVHSLRQVGPAALATPERSRDNLTPRSRSGPCDGFEQGQGEISVLVAEFVDELMQPILGRHAASMNRGGSDWGWTLTSQGADRRNGS
jgi:hypothetical protein